MIPLTAPEVRRLLWQLLRSAGPPPDFVLAWSHWRRRRQAQARRSHDKRRLAYLNAQVQLWKYEQLCTLLQGADLLGPAMRWNGGHARLWLLGDLVDRGPAASPSSNW